MKNDKRIKIAIFGGSFDPPHLGHIDIVKNLEKRFDKVIVMPSYISPFKTDGTDCAVRLKLCKKVFVSEKTEVSRYEIGKKGISYSVDTAAYFAKKTGAELYWVIGSEELKRLSDWHDIDRLKTLVKFYVVPRPGYPIDDSLLKPLKKRKIKLKLAPFVGLDISSTAVKIDMAFGKPNRYVPSAVYDYSVKNGLFDPYAVYVKGLREYGLSYGRIEHTYRVAVRGAELAKLYGASVNDVVIACILHDIAKECDPADYEGKVDMSGFPLPTVHGAIGAYIAQDRYGVSDDIAEAIRYHSTAKADMSVLDETVCLADKTESGRKYKSFELMLKLCALDKNIAMLYALKELRDVRRHDDGIEQCKYADDAVKYYEKICGEVDFSAVVEGDVEHSGNFPAVHKQGSRELREVRHKSKSVAKMHDKQIAPIADGKFDVSNITVKPREFVSSGDEIRDIALVAAAELSLRKARNVDIVNLNGKTIIADYFVIASASSTTAVKALMGYVEDKLTKQFGIDPNKRDVDSEWIALDYGGVIIHIFTDKTREFYNIERLWSDGKNIERFEDN